LPKQPKFGFVSVFAALRRDKVGFVLGSFGFVFSANRSFCPKNAQNWVCFFKKGVIGQPVFAKNVKKFTAEHTEPAERFKSIILEVPLIFKLPKFTFYLTTPVLYHILNTNQAFYNKFHELLEYI
jgi:hypothetical protein